ncbi:MAG: response regulator, partial [Deltaproteobacteria bacterium]|nr:response regulator [Deltaproteobacteria bacterium]
TFNRVYKTGKPTKIFDWEIIRKDTTKRYVETSVSLMKDAEGKPIGFRGIVRDITERKQAEEELEIQRARIKSLFDYSGEAMALLDLENHIIGANLAFEEVFGYPPEEAHGKVIEDLICPERFYYTEAKELDGQAMQGIKGAEIIRMRKDGKEINVRVSAGPIKVGSIITGRFVVFDDITERKRAEEQLKQAKEEAEEATQAKGEFLANMSHEIRTPMNAIMGMTDLALTTDLTKEQQEYMEMVKTSADSLLSLINDILDFSKIQARQLELEEIGFDLRTTLETATEMMAIRAHEKGLELACHVKPDVPTALMGDPVRLRQVILNLTDNAIKFTEKGEVVIHVDTEKEEDSSVLLHFMVSDTGLGIPPDKIETIFESFSQADGSTTRKYGGTGLGLAISKQIVEMMDGRIWVESAADFGLPIAHFGLKDSSKIQIPNSKFQNHGSIFHFTARFGLSRVEARETAHLRELVLSGVPVLIVDDNATNRLIFKEMTSSWGLVPTEAANGKEALAKIKKASDTGQPYRLVLLDLQMPNMDGFEVAKRAKEGPDGVDVEIILLTSVGQKGDAARCKEVGISGYLIKPVKQSELLDAITMALGHPSEQKAPFITRYRIQDARRRLNILLAEDNIVNQKLATKILEKRGHRVVVASNGKEAIEKLEGERFDLVLMDVQMPEMDGITATQQIRNPQSAIRNRNIPIIAMTAHAMKGDRERCLAAGMDDYVSKPINTEELFKVIEKLANGLGK